MNEWFSERIAASIVIEPGAVSATGTGTGTGPGGGVGSSVPLAFVQASR
jgi:hypothetical protein